jgi:hypothetical protein
VGLERDPLSLVSKIEELRKRKSSGSSPEIENTAVEIRHGDHVAPPVLKNWQQLPRLAAVAGTVQFAHGFRSRSLVFLRFIHSRVTIYIYVSVCVHLIKVSPTSKYNSLERFAAFGRKRNSLTLGWRTLRNEQ